MSIHNESVIWITPDGVYPIKLPSVEKRRYEKAQHVYLDFGLFTRFVNEEMRTVEWREVGAQKAAGS